LSSISIPPEQPPSLPSSSCLLDTRATSQVFKCKYCDRRFSPQRMQAHLKPSQKGAPPPCSIRFPCDQPGEPGCEKIFIRRRDRMRHRLTVCEHTRNDDATQPVFQCRCGKKVKRWYLLKNHQSACQSQPACGGPYICQCDAIFQDFATFEAHHKTEMGRPGRPPKA
jgi:hypothetical protein